MMMMMMMMVVLVVVVIVIVTRFPGKPGYVTIDRAEIDQNISEYLRIIRRTLSIF